MSLFYLFFFFDLSSTLGFPSPFWFIPLLSPFSPHDQHRIPIAPHNFFFFFPKESILFLIFSLPYSFFSPPFAHSLNGVGLVFLFSFFFFFSLLAAPKTLRVLGRVHWGNARRVFGHRHTTQLSDISPIAIIYIHSGTKSGFNRQQKLQ